MKHVIKKLLGYDDKFYDLLEASALEAQNSVQSLKNILQENDAAEILDEIVQARRQNKRIVEEVMEQLCKTFVTPLEREDIETLSVALYKVPKTIEKFSEKYLICRHFLLDINFFQQVDILSRAMSTIALMIKMLRERPSLHKIQKANHALHDMENEADKLLFTLIKDLYSGKYEPLKVVVIMDLYETLEQAIDRCRDASNVIFQVVLKYS